MRHMIAIVAALAFFVSGASAVFGAPPERYNFIVMMADDLGAAELACYGHKDHRTPNLDRLAQQGIRFETAYSTPICTSTRVMIMTGRNGFRTGYFNFMERTWSPKPGSPEHDVGAKTTFADLLKQAGYATGVAGKWQLTGEGENLVRDTGFDDYRIWAYKHNLPPGVTHTGAWENEKGQKTARYWHPSIVQNGKYMPTKETDYGPDLFADFIIDFARRHKDEPFVAYYPMALTHSPWDPTPDLASPGKKTSGGLKNNVEYMDHVVGRIVKAIDSLGLREKTIIIFTGDNGTQGNGKGQVTELGARVPFIASCPGTIPQGKVSGELVSLTDVLPTLVEFAGAKMPSDYVIDGVSLAPTLRGGTAEHRPWLFSYLGDGRMLRDKRWLLEGNGKFFDCGPRRDGTGYKDVTNSKDPEVKAARARFEQILKDLPGPHGHPGLKQPDPNAEPKKQNKKKNKAKAAA